MTPGFNIYTSNNIEQLAAQYSRCRIQSPEQFYSKDIFTHERIIIPSRNVRQWLERTLADQGFFLGNVDFSNIRRFISELLDQGIETCSNTESSAEPFGRKTMTWRIMGLLEQHPDDFPELQNYLESRKEGESEELRRYSLSDKIAALFYRYLEETPERLARLDCMQGCRTAEIREEDSFWTAGHWQAKLWRSLCRDEHGKDIFSPADRIMKFLTGDIAKEKVKDQVPITVFGFGSMTPAYLAVLKKLAEITAVNFFCIQPLDGHWTEEARKSWEQGTLKAEPERIDEIFRSQIIGQWALHQRQFFKTLLELSPVAGLPADTFKCRRSWKNPDRSDCLQGRFTASGKKCEVRKGTLQKFQQFLLDPNANLAEYESDDSISIHNCHNPAREVEILHDHLLHLIQSGNYTNSEILVAAPDITVFEPYVNTVFSRKISSPSRDGNKQPDRHLSYSLSGLGGKRSNPLADALLNLLKIKESRYELSYVKKLLMTPEIRKRFELDDTDLQTLFSWCEDAGIYWGADGLRENKYGIPDYENFSWQYGLDRMLLGFALTEEEDGETEWKDVAPFDACDSQGGRPQMKALLKFFRDLRELDELIDYSGPIEEWKERLKKVISTFFIRDLDRKALYRGLVSAVNFLDAQVTSAGYHRNIPREVICRSLSDLFSVPAEDEEFLNGKITFCNLRDARSIPCKVLCLLGMDENAFPNPSRPDSFNLIRDHLDETYRSPRFQDRYFFLENLLGVQDYLLIYYRGQDDVKVKEFSPSVVVSELTACIGKLFPGIKLETKHSLLPYSHVYFKEIEGNYGLGQRWSFNRDASRIDETLNDQKLEAAMSNQKKQTESERKMLSYRQPDLFPPPLSDIPVTVKLQDLEQFFINGGYEFLKNSFSFPPQPKTDQVSEVNEPINPDGLTAWTIKNLLSRWLVEKIPLGAVPESGLLEKITGIDELLDQCHKQCCRLNLLPPGKFGRSLLDELAQFSWIVRTDVREAWYAFCKSRENRSVEVVFDNEVAQLTDQEFNQPSSIDWDHYLQRYSKVILQYSTRKPENTAQVMLTLSSGNPGPKYKSRIYLRHLFFNAAGEEIRSHLMSGENSSHLDPFKVDFAKTQLQRILAVYLYGRNHPVPLMERSMWDGLENGFRKFTNQSEYGDFQLDYVGLLWGDEQPDDVVKRLIAELRDCLCRFPETDEP